MTENYYRRLADEVIRRWTDERYKDLKSYDISMVWSGYILGNRKGLFVILKDGTPFNGYYFEVTCSESRFTLDVYNKCDQIIQVREPDEH